MKEWFERVMSVVLTIAAVVIAAAIVRREFASAEPPPRERKSPEFVTEWKDIARSGRLVGSASAPVTIIEFMDLECPFCRGMNATLRAIAARHPNDVALVFVHYPLPNHRFARPAARAVECAGVEGRFRDLVDLVYEKQDSLGLKRWVSFAREAGVRDTAKFAKCVSATETVAAIERGVAAGKKIGVSGTPTIVFNGWRLPTPPTDTQLVRAIKDVVAGRPPYRAGSS